MNIINRYESAKNWIKEHCQVQWIVVRDYTLRKWAEHHILSVLRPQFCD
jgi:hypothetical protein